MEPKISREEAINLVFHSSHYNHSLRVSKMMLNLANYFDENESEWELVGLLHDLDYDETFANMHLHGIIAGEILHDKLSMEAINAIKSHDYRTDVKPKSLLSKILISVDALDNLIEILEKNNEKITSETILEKFEYWDCEKPWLKDLIKKVESCNINLYEFITVCLKNDKI